MGFSYYKSTTKIEFEIIHRFHNAQCKRDFNNPHYGLRQSDKFSKIPKIRAVEFFCKTPIHQIETERTLLFCHSFDVEPKKN